MTKRALLLTILILASSAASAAAQAAARPADILGKWEFTVAGPQGEQVVTMTFQRVDGALTGSGEGPMGAFALADIAAAGSDLTFAVRVEQNGQTFEVPFKGKVTGAAAEGTLSFPSNNGPQVMGWKAKKLPPV